MKNIYKQTIFLMFIAATQCLAAATIQLSGFVRDAQNGEVLIGANVWEKHQHAGTTTDNQIGRASWRGRV